MATTAVIPVQCEVLVLAVRCALARRSPAVAIVTRAVRDHAHELPAHTLDELEQRIAYWLLNHPAEARWDVTPWQVALVAVRRARKATPRVKQAGPISVRTNGCAVRSHGADGWHCAVEGPHDEHRNGAGDVTW